MIAAWWPLATAAYSAKAATTVLPEPTSALEQAFVGRSDTI